MGTILCTKVYRDLNLGFWIHSWALLECIYLDTPKLKDTYGKQAATPHSKPYSYFSVQHSISFYGPLWLHSYWESSICRDYSSAQQPVGTLLPYPYPISCHPNVPMSNCPLGMVRGLCILSSSPWGLFGLKLAGPSQNHGRPMATWQQWWWCVPIADVISAGLADSSGQHGRSCTDF